LNHLLPKKKTAERNYYSRHSKKEKKPQQGTVVSISEVDEKGQQTGGKKSEIKWLYGKYAGHRNHTQRQRIFNHGVKAIFSQSI